MKCFLCQNEARFETDNPDINLCSDCAEKANTHLPNVCVCGSVWWVPKNPKNIMDASAMTGVPPDYLAQVQVVLQIPHCKRCHNPHLEEYTKRRTFH